MVNTSRRACLLTAVGAFLGMLLLAAAAVPTPTPTEGGGTYPATDRYALSAPAEDEQSLDKLAAYLAKPCKTDLDKARAVYRWMTDRIAYDVEGFRKGSARDHRPETVLASRKAVCEGYANLYADLCKRMGVTVEKVSGFCKGVGYRRGQTFSRGNHAWNAVKIDGQWRLVDATWGAGSVDQDKFIKRFSEFFFLTPPEKLIFSHCPEDARWQLLEKPITQKQFEQRPQVAQELFELGVSVKDLHDAMGETGFKDFVKTYSHPSATTLIVSAPVSQYLQSGRLYDLQFKSDDYIAIALINGSKMQPLEREGNVFRLNAALQRGPAKIAGTLKGDQRYHTFLEYQVK